MMAFPALKIAFEVLVFFCFTHTVLGYELNFVPDNDIYKDLVELESDCYLSDSCPPATNEDFRPLLGNEEGNHTKDDTKNVTKCSCHADCAEHDTCCYNAPLRGSKVPLMECTRVSWRSGIKPEGYFLVGKCPSNDSVWKPLCEDKWNEDDDILRLAPVTSLDTHAVYKNVYCFRCHERTDNFHHWYLHLEGRTRGQTTDSKNYSVSYDQAGKTWVAISEDRSVSIPVRLEFSSRPERNSTENLTRCHLDIISDCNASWTDERIRDKCRAYTALRYGKYSKYRNTHCAICNYVPPENITCEETSPVPDVNSFGEGEKEREKVPSRPCVRRWGCGGHRRKGASSSYGGLGLFPFYHLLNFNHADRQKSQKLQRECEANHLWDPYGKKCRKIACAFPGYVVRNGRCIDQAYTL